MDSRIEILKKNYDERMNEFVNVLSRSECLPGCKVLDEWRFHLELTLKCSGWVAVYKPSKDRQPGLDFVNEIIMVEKVIYHNFEAQVIGLEQNENTSVSEASSMTSKIFSVALEDLYPCITQPDPDIDGVEINNILDKLRFFKQNLWLPWDEEDDNEDWRISSLEPRMQLLYDMENGQVSCEVAERVRRLFGQAWRAYESLRALEAAMDEAGDTASLGSQDSQNQDEEEGLVIRMMQLHHRIDNIQKELERLQNPLIRNLMIREKQRTVKRTRIRDQLWMRLVWSGGNAENLSSYLEQATSLARSKERLKVYPLLQMALEEADAGDLIVLTPGQYTLLGSGGLEEGGAIRGLGQEKVFLSGCESGDVMLSLCCEPVGRTSDEEACDTKSIPDFLLTNVSLDAHNLEICILINSGHVLLENCKIDGGGSHTANSVGVMVREGAKFTATNCIFTGFCSGLVAYEGSQLELKNCNIQNCEIGIKLFRGVKTQLERCVVAECSTSGVLYKWQCHEDDREDTVVTHDVLNSLPGVKVCNTEFQAVQVLLQQPTNGSPELNSTATTFL